MSRKNCILCRGLTLHIRLCQHQQMGFNIFNFSFPSLYQTSLFFYTQFYQASLSFTSLTRSGQAAHTRCPENTLPYVNNCFWQFRGFVAGLHFFFSENQTFRPKLDLHVHFYDLAYSNITIVCLKREFDPFLLFFLWASIFSQFHCFLFYSIFSYLGTSLKHLFLLNHNFHSRIITLWSLCTCFVLPLPMNFTRVC